VNFSVYKSSPRPLDSLLSARTGGMIPPDYR
jgi:hypothetical protein